MDQPPDILLALKQRIIDEFHMEVEIQVALFGNFRPYGMVVYYDAGDFGESMQVHLRDCTIYMSAADLDGPNFGFIEDFWPNGEDEFPGHGHSWHVDLFDHDFWEQIKRAIESWVNMVNDHKYRWLAEEFDKVNRHSWKLR